MTPLPLTKTPDRDQIDCLRSRLASQSCVVVGSAPLKAPASIRPYEYVICVNGSISSIAGPANLWLLNSKPNRTAMHQTMLAQARGREAVHVALLRGSKAPTEQQTLKHFAKVGCQIESWSVIDKPIKQWLEQHICERPKRGVKTACSAGIFATALALWCGAARVRMVGFSWVGGYQYTRGPAYRGHVEPDRRALRALVARYPGRLEGALVPEMAVAS